MASRVVLLNALYDQFISFVSELSEMYPEDADFPLFLTSVKMLKMTNPSMLAKYINENTAQFEQQIMNKEEQFFLTHDFESHGVNIDILSKLKTYVSSMTTDSKEHVWKYCQNILKLAKALA